MNTVELKNVTTGYGTTVVTGPVTAALPCGELISLLGPNGAGKSTLLRTIAGFQAPLGGTAEVMRRDVGRCSAAELSKLVGVVLTQRVEADNMSVRELVGLGRAPYTNFWGTLTADDERAVDEALAGVGAGELSGRRVMSLSDGERQKVMIARVLAQNTPVILLDEPTAFLDYPGKVEIMRLLREVAHERNKTVFLSTHDIEIALRVSDRIWLMDKTLGLEIGRPAELSAGGSISRYFDRPWLRFDASAGVFRF